MTAFVQFPPEILQMILRNLPDQPSLYNFICASARINAAFITNADNVTDAIIKRSIPEFEHLAPMVFILGLLDTSQLTFDVLVRKYKSLPKDVLTNCNAPFQFQAGTSGQRYLLLTAYRIEQLQHICFTTLLQNIHEVIFARAGKNTIAGGQK